MKTTSPPTASTANLRIVKRPSDERGRAEHGWLHSRFSFSFAEYHDPAHMGYRSLRVINDDFIEPGKGFGMHPHQSMEIFTYVIEGSLEHQDSMGNGRVIKAGEFQYMSAGSGVMHSEFNPSSDEQTHLLQIWIFPEKPGGEPRYADADPSSRRVTDGLTLLASPDGRDESMAMRQQAMIAFGDLGAGKSLEVSATVSPEGHFWIQMIQGELTIGEETFVAGDGGVIEGGNFSITANEASEFLLFELH
ncbi:MAG: pirin family protein [Verrucomicrobiae bacterium]|nr:pirin family protein [Verrucomicrobiae bacterium]